MKVAIGIPCPEIVHVDFALKNLPQIIAYTKSKFPDIELFIMDKQGVRTDSNRNSILKECLDNDVDAILWLDADMIYPIDILEAFIKSRKDIIGTLYFKRSEPYDPIAYVKGDNPNKPFKYINTTILPKNTIIEVDGLGFGGMFVNTEVYKKMGDEKWMTYGKNFHIPLDLPDKLSHDLVFCKKAQEYGFKLYLHTGVKAGHITNKLVTEDDWLNNRSKEIINNKINIAVICPTIDEEKAQKTLNQLKFTSGIEANFYSVVDMDRTGFITTLNTALKNIDANYYVYVAEDAYGGKDWLKIAYETMEKENSSLLAFNDGKWFGKLASFGMISQKFARENGYLLNPVYKSHYADTELTLIAMNNNSFSYNPESILIEVDYKKHGVNLDDKKTFFERKKSMFDKKVININLLNLFE